MRVLIAGAGIGGLTLAHVLRARGVEPVVREVRPQLPATGAGILLGPNVVAIYRRLGLLGALEAGGRWLHHLDLTDAVGRRLQRMTYASAALALDRGHLLAVLADGVPITFDAPVTRPTQATGAAQLSDGSRWDWLIGADGIGSVVRSAVPGAPSRIYAGQTCWRLLIDGVTQDHLEERWGDQLRVGVVPLEASTYVYLVASSPPGTPSQPTDPRTLAERFRPLHPTIAGRIEAASPEAVHHHDLEQLSGICFGQGRILLLGDAAHALTPNMGQGAGMAIEDAWVLGEALSAPDPLQVYASARRRRVERVWRTSHRIGTVAHVASPMARWARNALMRLTPSSLLSAQARWIAEGA